MQAHGQETIDRASLRQLTRTSCRDLLRDSPAQSRQSWTRPSAQSCPLEARGLARDIDAGMIEAQRAEYAGDGGRQKGRLAEQEAPGDRWLQARSLEGVLPGRGDTKFFGRACRDLSQGSGGFSCGWDVGTERRGPGSRSAWPRSDTVVGFPRGARFTLCSVGVRSCGATGAVGGICHILSFNH